jgi:predicted RNase H-related nuclease YkuK (DUF458 family)
VPSYPVEEQKDDIYLESDVQNVLYDVEKARRIVRNVSEPVMEEMSNAKKVAVHLQTLMEQRLY